MQNPKLLRSRPPNQSIPDARSPPPCLSLELILDILSRLSSKILCRFKCVSKDFLHLISSDSLLKDIQRSRFSKSTRLLQYDLTISNGLKSVYKLSQTTFDLTSGQELDKFDLEISRACGSRKLASFVQVTCYRELVCIYSDIQILVLNPSTHQVISFAVKNEILPNSVGIGYVDSCHEYKIVRINRTKMKRDTGYLIYHDLGCEIFTLKDDSYCYTVSTITFEGQPQDKHYDNALAELLPICVDGVFYWMCITCYRPNKMVVYYLNLKEDNAYGEIPFPGGDETERDERGATMAKLFELQGCLCVQQCHSLSSEDFVLYMLKDTKSGLWEQVYRIPYPPGIVGRRIHLRYVHVPDHISMEALYYRPPMTDIAPQVLGFLPWNVSSNGAPYFVLSELIDDETSQVHIVDNGTIKSSADIRFRVRRTRRLLYYEGLFSFKSL